MNEPIPMYLRKWARENKVTGEPWSYAAEVFENTANGKMIGNIGERKFDLVFDNDEDATWFMLRWV